MTTSTRASSMPPRSSPSTSTPPAWHFLEENYVPVTTDPGYYPADVDEMCRNYTEVELSTDSHSLSDSATLGDQNDSESPAGSRQTPDSATLGEQNGSLDPTGEDIWPLERDQCPDCRCAPNMPHAPECESTAQVTDSVINAAPSHAVGVRSVRETPTKLRVGAPNEHQTDTLSVPFKTQEFMFEELCEEMIAELPHLIFTHSERIIEMARDRFRKGYAKFGSEMYSWTPERRLDETLCELADAVVYPTSGPLE